MPKPVTLPTLLDQVKTLSISFLVKHGYLKINNFKYGIVTWSCNNIQTGSISIQVNTYSDLDFNELGYYFIKLNYNCNNTSIEYMVKLCYKISNIGKGLVWYFICPKTGYKCRKLYLVDTYFLHRKAFKGCMYEKQTFSKYARNYFKQVDEKLLYYKLISESRRKNFKKFYKGKPTKKFIKLNNQGAHYQ